MEKQTTRMYRFFSSFRHAFRGLRYVLIYERNFQVELIVALVVIIGIIVFRVKSWEAIVLLLLIMWVLVTELTNTVVERVVDILRPRVHPYARLIKDMMAAVVLISSLFAAVIGYIIFAPYIKDVLMR